MAEPDHGLRDALDSHGVPPHDKPPQGICSDHCLACGIHDYDSINVHTAFFVGTSSRLQHIDNGWCRADRDRFGSVHEVLRQKTRSVIPNGRKSQAR